MASDPDSSPSALTGILVLYALFFLSMLEPIGMLALFASLTAEMSEVERRGTTHRAVGYAAATLLDSGLVGQLLLRAPGVRLLSHDGRTSARRTP